ncbi:MAG: response regulator [Chloroflexota bacterium]
MASRPCIVSVEDDFGVFQLIQKILEPLPIDLHHAKNGHEAIALVNKLSPDLIMLDISLPDIHGWDVLKQVKAMQNGHHPSVMVLTAQTAPAHRVIGHLQEVNRYMSKPFLPHELRDCVTDILGIPSP